MTTQKSTDIPSDRTPAPWSLTGRGYIVVLRGTPTARERGSFLGDEFKNQWGGFFSYLIFADYVSSDVGPYRELLFVPGSVPATGGRRLTISKIYVSTSASVHNGRLNWGIPKEQCDFDVIRLNANEERVIATSNSNPLAEFVFRSRGPSFPFRTSWVPSSLRSFVQKLNGKTFFFTPEAKGTLQWAQLRHGHVDTTQFPDFEQSRIVAAFKVRNFQMTFPEAKTLHES